MKVYSRELSIRGLGIFLFGYRFVVLCVFSWLFCFLFVKILIFFFAVELPKSCETLGSFAVDV